METPHANPGLEGVVAADTALSAVDGAAGRLIIAGLDVEALAGGADFTAAAARLWRAAGLEVPDDLAARLGAARRAAHERLPRLGDALDAADAMDALRAGLAHLAPAAAAAARLVGPGRDAAAGAAELDDAVQLTAAAAVVTAAWARRRAGAEPIPPDPARPHAEDLLRLRSGREPDPAAARGLDRYLVTVIDHGMNASTFTARVVASTGSDAVSAVVAAVGALKGPLHGGAPGPVLDMLDAIGAPGRARDWLAAELAEGRRIMGMGHRIYRVRDPRAQVLEQALLEVAGARADTAARLELARVVEREATALLAARHPDRPLRANVEFYTALLLEAVGAPRALFAALFACGRVAGWLAHVAEQRRTGRLIRPASRYVGVTPASDR